MTNSSSYGDSCAPFYDEIYGPPKADVLRGLCSLAKGGSVLELGLATGRTALALFARGLTVSGIESSSAMLDQLRCKPGVDNIHIVEGDFANICLPEQFDLVFALVNTFCLLETKLQQSECLRNVAEMLKSDGVLVLEMFRPGNGDGEITAEGIRSSVRHELETKFGRRVYEVDLLYPTVEDLDTLAEDAGLTLKQRWGDWRGTPYRPEVGNHVTLYGRTSHANSLE